MALRHWKNVKSGDLIKVSGYVGPVTGFIYGVTAVVKQVVGGRDPYVVFWVIGGEKYALHLHHAQLLRHRSAKLWAAGLAGIL
jgi:hypothetical protein